MIRRLLFFFVAEVVPWIPWGPSEDKENLRPKRDGRSAMALREAGDVYYKAQTSWGFLVMFMFPDFSRYFIANAVVQNGFGRVLRRVLHRFFAVSLYCCRV